MSEKPVIRWRGGYCRFESSHDGKAILRIAKNRIKRDGSKEFVNEEIEIDRSSIRCIYVALKQFADSERSAIEELPV